MPDIFGDNRFEVIAEYKKRLIEGTNIESCPEELAGYECSNCKMLMRLFGRD